MQSQPGLTRGQEGALSKLAHVQHKAAALFNAENNVHCLLASDYAAAAQGLLTVYSLTKSSDLQT